jgi:hypothetical protein
MAMKALSFLRCGFIVLSLFAGRAGAQIDSNSVVSMYCGSVEKGCSMYLSYGKDTFFTSLQLGFSSSFRIANEGPSQPTGQAGHPNPSFGIDSTNHEILNLSLYVTQYISGAGANSGGEDLLELKFPPVPYIIEGNQIFADAGVYQCQYSFSSVLQSFVNGTTTCSDTGSIADSLFLQIKPSSSGVRYSNLSPRIEFLDNGIQLFEFASSSETRGLEICNTIGEIVSRTSISPTSTSEELSIPPGLYFARLGNQVTKFVVPPR